MVEFDPLVIMNPLDGKSNVAKSCFAYGSLTWWFGKCWNSVAGVLQRGGGEEELLLDLIISF